MGMAGILPPRRTGWTGTKTLSSNGDITDARKRDATSGPDRRRGTERGEGPARVTKPEVGRRPRNDVLHFGRARISVSLAAGTRLGGYEIVSLLGEGGMGQRSVW